MVSVFDMIKTFIYSNGQFNDIKIINYSIKKNYFNIYLQRKYFIEKIY